MFCSCFAIRVAHHVLLMFAVCCSMLLCVTHVCYVHCTGHCLLCVAHSYSLLLTACYMLLMFAMCCLLLVMWFMIAQYCSVLAMCHSMLLTAHYVLLMQLFFSVNNCINLIIFDL